MYFPLINRALIALNLLPAIFAYSNRMAERIRIHNYYMQYRMEAVEADSHYWEMYGKIEGDGLDFKAFQKCCEKYPFQEGKLAEIYQKEDSALDIECIKSFFCMQLNQWRFEYDKAKAKTDVIFNKMKENDLGGIDGLLNEFDCRNNSVKAIYKTSRITVLYKRLHEERTLDINARNKACIEAASYSIKLSKLALVPVALSTAACVLLEMSDKSKLIVSGLAVATNFAMNYFMSKDTSAREGV